MVRLSAWRLWAGQVCEPLGAWGLVAVLFNIGLCVRGVFIRHFRTDGSFSEVQPFVVSCLSVGIGCCGATAYRLL